MWRSTGKDYHPKTMMPRFINILYPLSSETPAVGLKYHLAILFLDLLLRKSRLFCYQIPKQLVRVSPTALCRDFQASASDQTGVWGACSYQNCQKEQFYVDTIPRMVELTIPLHSIMSRNDNFLSLVMPHEYVVLRVLLRCWYTAKLNMLPCHVRQCHT